MKEHYDFLNAIKNPYLSKLENNSVSDEEMAEILENKKLIKGLKKSMKEAAEGRYKIID